MPAILDNEISFMILWVGMQGFANYSSGCSADPKLALKIADTRMTQQAARKN